MIAISLSLDLRFSSGKMVRIMYIPTQEERYSKVARLTLFLCIMLPSAIAMPLDWAGFNKVAAICISALILRILIAFAIYQAVKAL